MKKIAGLFLLSVVLVVGVLFVNKQILARDEYKVVWEYKFQKYVGETQANELGKEGWEMVSAIPMSNSEFFNCVFKREKK